MIRRAADRGGGPLLGTGITQATRGGRGARSRLARCALALLVVLVGALAAPSDAHAITESEYSERANAFINDARWANGTSWGQRAPKLSTYSCAGCFAYACDFTKYVYGIDNYQNGTGFWSVSDIRKGDVIRISNHTFVVLDRSGSELYTAEGAFSDKVRVAYPGYKIAGSGLTDTWGNGKSFEVGYHFDITSDTTPPQVSNFHVDEFRDGAFTVMAHVTDNQAVSSVKYAIWSDKDGQDDLVWQDGHCTDNNNIYWSWVNFSEHNGERGNYIIHIYAYDAAGNCTKLGIGYNFDSEGPVISDVQVSDVSDAGYTISCKVSDEQMDVSRVQFPTWTLYNDQDDIASEWWTNAAVRGTIRDGVATFRVNISDHNGETGRYVTHIYAYDTLGNSTFYHAPIVDLLQHEPADLSSNTSFLIIPSMSQTRGLMLDHVANGSVIKLGTIGDSNPSCYQYRFIKDANGYYGIQSVRDSAYYLHVTGDSTNHIHSWGTYGNGLSMWIPQLNTDGTYSFWNPSLETYMNVQNSVDADGTLIISHPSNGGDNQKYRLVPVDKPLSADDVIVTCPESVTLEGKSAKPDVKVEFMGITLVEGEDYTVTYEKNDRPGTATATITGMGGVPSSTDLRGFRGYYTGTRAVSFEVVGDAEGPDLSRDGWVDLSGGRKGYVKMGKLVKGWLDIGSSKYWFDADGVMATGWTDVEVSGKTMHYYFNPSSGNLARGTWMEIDGAKYYFRPSGNVAHGWATITDNGVDKKYYFDDSYQMVTGWQEIEVNGKQMRYYFRPAGSMATGWATIDGQKYFFRDSGNMATGFTTVTDGTKRYFHEDGTMHVGWLDLGGKTYYFRASGAMQTGTARIGDFTYTFSASGVLQEEALSAQAAEEIALAQDEPTQLDAEEEVEGVEPTGGDDSGTDASPEEAIAEA